MVIVGMSVGSICNGISSRDQNNYKSISNKWKYKNSSQEMKGSILSEQIIFHLCIRISL